MNFSSSEIDEYFPYNILETQVKPKSNLFNNSNNSNIIKKNSINPLLNNLSNLFTNYYESTMKIFIQMNNNNQIINNQILYSKYLLTLIKNKSITNNNIKNEIEKLNNHLIKMDYCKSLINKNISLLNNSCIYFQNNFQKILKNLKNTPKKSRNSEIKSKTNYYNLLGLQNVDYNSCRTSVDKIKKPIYSNSNSSNKRYNKNNDYMYQNNSLLNSLEKKRFRNLSCDRNSDVLYLHPKNNTSNKYNSSIVYNNDINDELYNNNEYNLISPYYDINNKTKNKKNLKRCASLSNMGLNISNIINNNDNNNYKNVNDLYRNKNENIDYKLNNNKLELDLAIKIISLIKIQNNISNTIDNQINNKIIKLKNYILFLSKKIIEKYNINNMNINDIIKNINNNDINKKYDKILLEYKINLDKLNNIQKENNLIKSKYIQLNKNLKDLQQKYNNLLNKSNNSNKQRQFINRNNNINNELSLSQNLLNITKLSHQNSIYLIEMNKLKKEKDILLQKLENNKSIKNPSSYTNLIITKNNFLIKSNTHKIKENYFNNIIKEKEEEIEKLKKEIRGVKELNINISKLNEEIKHKNNDIEIKNKKIEELNIINNNNENKIKELIDQQKNNEKNDIINKEQIEKLTKENEQYINNSQNNINEINNLKNTINDLQNKLNKQNNNTINFINTNNNSNIINNNNSNSNINSLFNSNNDDLNRYSLKEGKDLMTPAFLSFEKNSKKSSMDEGENFNENNNKNIINEYESKIKLLKESNNQLIKELNDIKNNSYDNNVENDNGSNGNKKIYKPEEYLIISDKNKDGLKWFLLKNKKYEKNKNSYNNLFWVNIDCILDIKKYNKFISEEDEMNEIIINNIKKLEEKENIISKLNYKIENMGYYIFSDDEIEEEEPKQNKKKIQKSKSEQTFKNKINNSQNIFMSNKNKFKLEDNEQNLNDNIKDDFSKNQYFYLEGNGLGLLNND